MKRFTWAIGALVLVGTVLWGASTTPMDQLPDGGAAVATDTLEVFRSKVATHDTTDFAIQLSDVVTLLETDTLDDFVSNDGCAFSFTEDGSATAYTATCEIPAGSIVHDICFVTTVLWDGTSASLGVGDDDDPDGWFTTVNLKATDLLVGEVICAADEGGAAPWGGVQGAYLVAATGRRGRVTAGVDSGWYYGAASEVIFVVTPGAADGSAGRSFGWVNFSTPNWVASTNT